MEPRACTDGKGVRQDHPATGVLVAPDGVPVPGGFMCRQCAQVVIDEYALKLDEAWTFEVLR